MDILPLYRMMAAIAADQEAGIKLDCSILAKEVVPAYETIEERLNIIANLNKALTNVIHKSNNQEASAKFFKMLGATKPPLIIHVTALKEPVSETALTTKFKTYIEKLVELSDKVILQLPFSGHESTILGNISEMLTYYHDAAKQLLAMFDPNLIVLFTNEYISLNQMMVSKNPSAESTIFNYHHIVQNKYSVLISTFFDDMVPRYKLMALLEQKRNNLMAEDNKMINDLEGEYIPLSIEENERKEIIISLNTILIKTILIHSTNAEKKRLLLQVIDNNDRFLYDKTIKKTAAASLTGGEMMIQHGGLLNTIKDYLIKIYQYQLTKQYAIVLLQYLQDKLNKLLAKGKQTKKRPSRELLHAMLALIAYRIGTPNNYDNELFNYCRRWAWTVTLYWLSISRKRKGISHKYYLHTPHEHPIFCLRSYG